MERDRPNTSSAGRLNFTLDSKLFSETDNSLSNIPAQSATHRADAPSASPAVNSELDLLNAALSDIAPARVLGMPSSPIPIPATKVKTSPAASVLFRGSLQYFCVRHAHCNAKFANLGEKRY